MPFFMLIKVEMPTVVGISTFMSKKKIMLRAELSVKKFYNLGTGYLIGIFVCCVPFLVTMLYRTYANEDKRAMRP